MDKKSVLLGFSGGIDSRTAIERLRSDGYRVVALTINTMGDEEFMQMAHNAANEQGVEWIGYDAREEFKRDIIDYFCNEYASGRTPAPCTRCNTLIKWKILLKVANEHNFGHIATGHYFRIVEHNGMKYVARGADPIKDQSYYLWGLSQEILSRAITPMGNAIKSEVKAHFENKSESMGICFLRGKHYTEFLAEHNGKAPSGDIVDSNNEVVGQHNGIFHYTAGQRRGEGIPTGLRVLHLDAVNNRVVVGNNELLFKKKVYIDQCNIVDNNELLTATDITIKIRGIGRNPELPVSIEQHNSGYMITTTDPMWAPAVGQPLVFYRNNLVIGGGIVESFE